MGSDHRNQELVPSSRPFYGVFTLHKILGGMPVNLGIKECGNSCSTAMIPLPLLGFHQGFNLAWVLL